MVIPYHALLYTLQKVEGVCLIIGTELSSSTIKTGHVILALEFEFLKRLRYPASRKWFTSKFRQPSISRHLPRDS